MNFEVTVAPRVVEEYQTMVQWWVENRPDSRLDLYREFDSALAYLEVSPLAASRYRFDNRYLTYRIKTTPYVLLYRVDETRRSVFVISAWSAQRGEDPTLP